MKFSSFKVRPAGRRGLVLALSCAAGLTVPAVWLLVSSETVANYLADTAAHQTFRLEAGRHHRPWSPPAGPYDRRLGYRWCTFHSL